MHKSLLSLLFFVCVAANGQNVFNNYIEFKPTAPEATSIQKYGDVSPPNAFGVVPVEIPITTIAVKAFKMPIVLSYVSGSGIKNNQTSSYLGLGWDLNILESYIEVIVSGSDDFTTAHDALSNFNELYTREQSSNINDLEVLLEDLKHNAMSSLNSSGHKDYQGDEFNYNFNGITGNFFKDSSGEITAFNSSGNDLKIFHNSLNEFEIVDQGGNHYIFNKLIAYTTDNTTRTVRKRYYLTKIETWSNQNIFFNYSDGSELNFGTLMAETNKIHTAVRMLYQNLENNDGSLSLNDFTPDVPQVNTSQIYYNRNIINSITWPGGQLQFVYGKDTQGIVTLKSIEKKSSTNILKEKFIFLNDTYYKNFSNANAAPKLEGINRVGGNMIVPLYRFSYNLTAIPDRGAIEGDYWGFNAGVNADEFPDGSYFYDNKTHYFYGKNRSPNTTYTGAGILESVSYPTGGKTHYEYEPNFFPVQLNGSNVLLKGGGLRIKSIKNFLSATDSNPSESFFYEYGTSVVGVWESENLWDSTLNQEMYST